MDLSLSSLGPTLRMALLGLASLFVFGCNNGQQVVVANNTPPLIVLVEPVLEDDTTPVALLQDIGLSVIVQVEDAEDDFDELEVTWTALSTDVADGGTLLGQTQPDTTGRSELLVVGLDAGLWYLKIEVEDSDEATESVQIPLEVSPSNYPPSLSSAALTPDPAYKTSTLNCEALGWSDSDGDPPGWTFAWYRNEALLPGLMGQTLDGTNFDRGDALNCEVTPFDGQLSGDPVFSNTVLVLNSPPSAPTVLLSPLPAAATHDDLECSILTESEDPDGDVLTNPDSYSVFWQRDSVAVPEFDGEWTIPSDATDLGEMWTCLVQATDGQDLGAVGEASTPVLPEDGDFVITEFMAEPLAVSSAAGEWVELYNASGTTLNLNGFELHDGASDSHLITIDLEVAPAGRVVLGRNGDFATNGNVNVDYEYSGVTLLDGQDALVLSFDGAEVDRVDYDLSIYGAAPGHALALNPDTGVPSGLVNDDPQNWCLAGDLFAGLGMDYGTPGEGNGDCDCYLSDGDGDGFGDAPGCVEIDCDDNEPLSYPGGVEVCDGIDNDCHGGIDDGFDSDTDGVTTCGPDGVPGTADDDCDDNDPLSFPGNAEVCDGIDNNCSGAVDDPFDVDGDGYATCGPDGIPGTSDDDCDDLVWAINPGNAEVCDGLDNDCSGVVDDGFDADVDGVTTCGPDGVPGTADDDCDDSEPLTFPGNAEVCDGIDNNCSGAVDDPFDVDGDGYATCGPDGIAGTSDDDCNDLVGIINPGYAELCDGLDNDCSGVVDDTFDMDGDGVTTCGPDGIPGNGDDDCDDNDPLRSPVFTEQCNGIDDDCDWAVDEDFDLDGDNVTTCGPDFNFATTGDNDCNDDPLNSGALAFPGATESCDGVDNDCDGSVDEANAQGCLPWYADSDGDGYGVGSSSCLCSPVGNLTAGQGGDCYDGNASARPGQSAWFTSHRGDGNHDFNCDGQQSKRYTTQSGSCAFFSNLCDGGTGWSGSPPACGTNGTWRGGCYYSTSGWPWEWGCYWGYSYGRAQQCR